MSDPIADILDDEYGAPMEHHRTAAEQIRQQIGRELLDDIYAAETIEHNYAGKKCEYIRVIDLMNIIDSRCKLDASDE